MSAADRLDQRSFRPEEAFLVRIQYAYKGYFRQIQAFPQQVDAHQRIELAESQIAQDLVSFQRIHFGVHVADLQPRVLQVFRKAFRHLLGEGGHQHAVTLVYLLVDLAYEVVYLPFRGNDLYGRIQQSRGPDDLLCGDAAGHFPFRRLPAWR